MENINYAPEDLSHMYHVPAENGLTPEEWPIPDTLQIKADILEVVKWTATPLDINIVRTRWGGGLRADVMFAGYTGTDRRFMSEITLVLSAIGWTVVSTQNMTGYLVVNLQKSV